MWPIASNSLAIQKAQSQSLLSVADENIDHERCPVRPEQSVHHGPLSGCAQERTAASKPFAAGLQRHAELVCHRGGARYADFSEKPERVVTYTLRFASRRTAAIPCRRFNRSNWRWKPPERWVQIIT